MTITITLEDNCKHVIKNTLSDNQKLAEDIAHDIYGDKVVNVSLGIK